MACIPGRLAALYVSFDNGITYNKLGAVIDLTLNLNVDELECTTHDSGGTRDYIPNFSDATIDGSVRWDEDDPQQVSLLFTMFPDPTSYKIQFMLEEKEGRRRFDADAFLTSMSPSAPLDGTVDADVAMRLSSVVLAVQPAP